MYEVTKSVSKKWRVRRNSKQEFERRGSYLDWSNEYFIEQQIKNPQSWGKGFKNHVGVQNVCQGYWILKDKFEDEIERFKFNSIEEKRSALRFIINKVKNLKRKFYIDSCSLF